MSFKVKLPVMACGAHYDYKFNWWLQDEDGSRVAADLTGYTARMDIKKGSTVILRLTTENGFIKLAGNVIHLDVPADVSDTLAFSDATYDLLLLPNGEATKAKLFMHGTIPGYQVGTTL